MTPIQNEKKPKKVKKKIDVLIYHVCHLQNLRIQTFIKFDKMIDSKFFIYEIEGT